MSSQGAQGPADEPHSPAPATTGAAGHPLLTGATGEVSLLRPALLGTLATVLITAGASQPGSPFAVKQANAWFFGIPGPFTDARHGLVLGLLAVYGGLALLVVVWLELVRTLHHHPGVAVGRLVPVFAFWAVPLVVGPPLFSQDVYSYAALGAMVSEHLNPYRLGTDILGASPFGYLVDPMWSTTPTPYGPLFLGLAGMIVSFTGHHVLAAVVGMRLVEVVAVCALALCVTQLGRHYGRDVGECFALAILNPVTMLEIIGGAHNDGLMVALLAGGILVAKRGRPLLGIVLCSLAAAVKFPAGLGILFIGWEWLGPGRSWRERLRPLLTACLVGLAVMELLARVTRLGWGWLGALGTPDTVRSFIDPATALGMLVGTLAQALGFASVGDAGLAVVRGLGEALAVCACLALLWRSSRLGGTRSLALGLLAVVVLGPVIQPWYLSWGLLLLVPVATGRLRTLVIGLSIFAALLPLQDGGLVFSQLGLVGAFGALAVVVLMVFPASPFVAPLRQFLGRLKVAVPDVEP